MKRLAAVLVCGLVACACGSGGGGDEDADATDVAGEEVDATPDTTADTAEEPPVDVPEEDPAEEEEAPDGPCLVDGDCDDGDPCTQDACDTDAGTCSHEPVDADGDGYVAAEVDGESCGGEDCDDDDDRAHPDSGNDDCEGGDLDCNGVPDTDDDEDGYVDATCTGGDDCDDDDATFHPGSDAVDCSSMDHDCNGNADEDNDGDGQNAEACGGDDCDDGDDLVYFGASELACDGKDTNCDGYMDSVEDFDADGYANATCAASGAEVDCDDENDEVWPGATELCDEIDHDCDGSWADGGADDDGDGVLDAACGGDDCDDTLDTVFLGADEVCVDGVDQDCDTLVDGPVFLPAPARFSSAAVVTDVSSIVWSGSEWAVAWEDSRYFDHEIMFARLDEDGAVVGAELRVTNHAASSRDPSMAWTGSEYAIAWRDNPDTTVEILLARVSADGTKLGTDVQVTAGAGYVDGPDIVWTGSELGLAWHDDRDGNQEIYCARLDPTGAAIGSHVRVTNEAAESRWVAMAWGGSEYGLVWRDGRTPSWDDVWFTVLDGDGTKLVSDTRISGDVGWAWFPDIAWAGSNWGIVWMDDRHSFVWEIYLGRWDSSGAAVGSEVRVTDDAGSSEIPVVAWSGSELAVMWLDDRLATYYPYVARIDESGAKVTSDVQLMSAADADAFAPSVAWSGSSWGLSWFDQGTVQPGMYHESIAMCD